MPDARADRADLGDAACKDAGLLPRELKLTFFALSAFYSGVLVLIRSETCSPLCASAPRVWGRALRLLAPFKLLEAECRAILLVFIIVFTIVFIPVFILVFILEDFRV